MQLTFKQKLVFSILALSAVPLIIFSAITLNLKLDEAHKFNVKKLASIREEFDNRVHHDFMAIHALARTTANMHEVRTAITGFTAALNDFDPANVSLNAEALRQRYAYQQEKTVGAAPGAAESWQPTDPKLRALQHLYISANTNPIGEKQKLTDAGDGSAYSRLHAVTHPLFRNFVDEFGYYDLFLINSDGAVVYTNFKEIDFLANVKTGPLASTNLGAVVRQALAATQPGQSFMSDFQPYFPSYNDSAAFVAAPVFENDQLLGVVALQLPTLKLTEIFKTASEFGITTDAYMINAEGRYLTQPAYVDAKIGDNIPASLKDAIGNVFAANEDGIFTFTENDGEAVIAAVEMIEVPSHTVFGQKINDTDKSNLPWAVVVRIAESEVMDGFMKTLWLVLGILSTTIAITAFVGLWLARVLVKPVVSLGSSFNQSAERVGRATGQVGDAVNNMIAASEETSAQSVVIRKNSSEAAGFVGGVTAAVEELNVSIGDISQSIAETNVLIDDAVEKARKTNDVVRNLGQAAKKITEVVSLINDLAEQTNLLALNAAIEAARAGDAGRGFAVVADEVKKLASHTSQATIDIREQVREIQDVSEQSVVALQAVVEAIHRIRDNATTVSAAVEEQSGVAKQIAGSVRDAADRVKQVDDNMTGIEQAANDTGVAADQVSGSVKEVQDAFTDMKTGVQSVLNQMGVK